MRLAVISDIHGNLAALESVLAEIRKLSVDAIHCLGDVVGYGPFPNECLDIVRTQCHTVIKGNHDSAVIGETPYSDFNEFGQAAIKWTTRNLRPENLEYLRSLPLMVVHEPVTLVHASPVNPESWTYILTTRTAEENLKAFSTDICFIGHTHVPVVIGSDSTINVFKGPDKSAEPPRRYIINVGSVGQPRNGDPRSAFGLLDTERWTYEPMHVEYDIAATSDAIRKAGLPAFLAKRLFRGV